MANPYSKYTGQRVSAIPAGYLQANAIAAANMQKGLASIGEGIGKYYANKRKKEEEDKQKEAVLGAYEIGGKLTETYTDSDLMIGELAGTDEFGNRINSFGETIEVANPMPEAVGTDLRKIGGVEEPKQFFGSKDAMSVGRSKNDTPQDLPALPKGPAEQAPKGAGSGKLSDKLQKAVRDARLDAKGIIEMLQRTRGDAPVPAAPTPTAPDPLDVVPSGGGLEPIAPYSPEAAPESTIKEGFEPARIDPQLEYLAKPQIDRVEFAIETEKQRNRTVNENMTEWLSTYGKDADATTAAQAYDIIKGYADTRNAREDRERQIASDDLNRASTIQTMELKAAQEGRAVRKEGRDEDAADIDTAYKMALINKANAEARGATGGTATPLSTEGKKQRDIVNALKGPGGITSALQLIKADRKSKHQGFQFEHNPETGKTEMRTGGSGELGVALRNKYTALRDGHNNTILKARRLKNFLTPENVGARGVFRRKIGNELFGQIFPGAVNEDVTEAGAAIGLFRESVLKSVSDDSRFSNADREAIMELLPKTSALESAGSARAKVDAIIQHFEGRSRYYSGLLANNETQSDWEMTLPFVQTALLEANAEQLSLQERQALHRKLMAGLYQMGATPEDINFALTGRRKSANTQGDQ